MSRQSKLPIRWHLGIPSRLIAEGEAVTQDLVRFHGGFCRFDQPLGLMANLQEVW